MKKTILASALTLSMVPAAQADFIGLYVGAYHWDTDYEGYIQDGPSRMDGVETLGVEEEPTNVIYVAFEHPVPFLPNIKIAQNQVEVEGQADAAVSGSFIYGDTNFTGTHSSVIDFSFTDVTLYYELLDNVVSLDLGLTARMLDGEATVEGNGVPFPAGAPAGFYQETGEFDPTLPMIYVMAGADLPLTGLSLRAELNYLGFGGDETDGFTDLATYVNWEAAFGLGVMAGYRTFSFEYDDDKDKAAKLDMDGAFVGLSFHF